MHSSTTNFCDVKEVKNPRKAGPQNSFCAQRMGHSSPRHITVFEADQKARLFLTKNIIFEIIDIVQ